jgi:hypothetical protein
MVCKCFLRSGWSCDCCVYCIVCKTNQSGESTYTPYNSFISSTTWWIRYILLRWVFATLPLNLRTDDTSKTLHINMRSDLAVSQPAFAFFWRQILIRRIEWSELKESSHATCASFISLPQSVWSWSVPYYGIFRKTRTLAAIPQGQISCWYAMF